MLFVLQERGDRLKRGQLKVLYRPDGTVEVEGPASLVRKYHRELTSRRGRGGAGADAAELPEFFDKVAPRRGEDVLTVAYFLNRRAGDSDFDRGELSRAIARCPGKKKKVNAATVYALLGNNLLVKTRRGR